MFTNRSSSYYINSVSTGIPSSGFRPGNCQCRGPNRNLYTFLLVSGQRPEIIQNFRSKPGIFPASSLNLENFPNSSGFRDIFPGSSKFRVEKLFRNDETPYILRVKRGSKQ